MPGNVSHRLTPFSLLGDIVMKIGQVHVSLLLISIISSLKKTHGEELYKYTCFRSYPAVCFVFMFGCSVETFEINVFAIKNS